MKDAENPIEAAIGGTEQKDAAAFDNGGDDEG